MDVRRGIGARGCGGDVFGIRALVMGRRADDRIEGGASAPTISSAFLSREAPVTRIQSSVPWIAMQACQRLPDAVGGVTDVDDGERVLTDDLEAAGPARIAQAGAYRSLDSVGSLARLLALQPQQKQGDGNG